MSNLKDGAYLYCQYRKFTKQDGGYGKEAPHRYTLTVPFPQYPCDLRGKPIVQAAVEYFECVSRLHELLDRVSYSYINGTPLRDSVHGHKLPEGMSAYSGLVEWMQRMHFHATGYGIRQFPTEFKHYFKTPGLHYIMWAVALRYCRDSLHDWEAYYAAESLAHSTAIDDDMPFQYDFCNPVGMECVFGHASPPEGSIKERKKKEEEYVPTYDI